MRPTVLYNEVKVAVAALSRRMKHIPIIMVQLAASVTLTNDGCMMDNE
jgi:hypothetical protein